MFKQYFTNNGKDVIFNGEYLEIFIPEYYFESNKYASVYGNIIKSFGIINGKIYKGSKVIEQSLINIPTMINLHVNDVEKRNDIAYNDPNILPYDYRVLKFYKNDKVFNPTIELKSDYAQAFLYMLCNGKLNPNVPYDKLLEVWINNFLYTSVNLGIPISVMSIIINGLYRYRDNPDLKFSEALNTNPKLSMYRYHRANIREVCSKDSVFSALTFEDMDSMLTSSLNMSNYDKKQSVSPIEKIVKM